jgi:glycosyltransferase involved in cell wall biosynthesis
VYNKVRKIAILSYDMKILLINKYHYLKGGAERAYFDTARVLREAGHEVAFFSMADDHNEPTPWNRYFVERVEYSDDRSLSMWQKLRLAAKIIWNREAQQKLEQLLQEFQPDVAHLHNIYHQLSPSIIWTLKKHGVPMVMTLHDYKLISPNYSLFVRGQIWEGSKPNRYWKCVHDACVKDSRMKSLVCMFEAYVHEWLGTYAKVDRYIAPSHFLIEKFQEYGFASPIKYVPQPVVISDGVAQEVIRPDAPFVFLGRLSQEKGVDVVIRAMANYQGQSKLEIIGDGPMRAELEALTVTLHLQDRIVFLGAKYGEEVTAILRSARALLVPSVWYENMPYVVLEALVEGIWVIASRSGGITERIKDGINGSLFEIGDISGLTQCLEQLVGKQPPKEMILALRSELLPGKYRKTLEKIYEEISEKAQ